MASGAKDAKAEAKDAETEANASDVGAKVSGVETDTSAVEDKAVEEPEVVILDQEDRVPEKEGTATKEMAMADCSKAAEDLPPPGSEMQLIAPTEGVAKVGARPRTSSRPILELLDYNSDVARLR